MTYLLLVYFQICITLKVCKEAADLVPHERVTYVLYNITLNLDEGVVGFHCVLFSLKFHVGFKEEKSSDVAEAFGISKVKNYHCGCALPYICNCIGLLNLVVLWIDLVIGSYYLPYHLLLPQCLCEKVQQNDNGAVYLLIVIH